MGQSILRGRRKPIQWSFSDDFSPKGNPVNIPEPDFGMVAVTLKNLETLVRVLGRVFFSY
jgi:hypothetical protein